MHYFGSFILAEGFVATGVETDPQEYTGKGVKDKKKGSTFLKDKLT